jgi:hypothetical protein
MKETPSRRDFMRSAALGALGSRVLLGREEQLFATNLPKGEAALDTAFGPGEMPQGKIGDVTVSRMILGGNLMSGYAHSRDLVYVSRLMREYNSVERIVNTLDLAEAAGVNTVLSDPWERPTEVLTRHRERGGKMQWIIDCRPEEEDIRVKIDEAIEKGACAIYVNGEWSGDWVLDGKVDFLGTSVEYIRSQGLPAGVGGHLLDVPVACEEAGIRPDFYMKTLHSHEYWSAGHSSEHDNVYCRKPEETIAFMKGVPVPWIAFKTLAAGAIAPDRAFDFALKNGADFLCVGMFDFQLAYDVRLFKKMFSPDMVRERPLFG